MRRMLSLWLILLLLPAWGLAEDWCRVPLSLLPDTWLTATGADGIPEVVAVITPPDGLVQLEGASYIPDQADVLSLVAYAASALSTDAQQGEQLAAGGRMLRYTMADGRLTASFRTARAIITLTVTAAGDAGEAELLARLSALVHAVQPVGETDPMPVSGLYWGMVEDALTELLGLSVYETPLSAEGWRAGQYLLPALEAEVAEVDCCMKDGRLAMVLVGLEQEDTARAAALLSVTMGEPSPALPADVSSVLDILLGPDESRLADMSFSGEDAPVVFTSPTARVVLFRWAGIVMAAYLDPCLFPAE